MFLLIQAFPMIRLAAITARSATCTPDPEPLLAFLLDLGAALTINASACSRARLELFAKVPQPAW